MASPALPIPFPNHPLEHSRHNGDGCRRHHGDYSRGLATTGPAPALTPVMTPAATAALMMLWRK